MKETIAQAAAVIASKSAFKPRIGIILGTGLGQLADEVQEAVIIPYAELPGFPEPTVESHSGRLILGTLEGVPVAVMQGRFHLYEGYTAQEIALPVRILKAAGIEKLFISNVSGGLNPDYEIGDIMLLNDHINLQPQNPLIGPNDEEMGPRFPDMLHAYDPQLLAHAANWAKKQGIRCHQGVYSAVMGPNLETVAEYAFLRWAGADAVGMSTVPEVITARHMDLPVFAASIITDLCVPGKIKPVSVPKIIAAAMEAQPKLSALFKEMVQL